MISTREKGNMGEEFACRVLEKSGARILCRNFRGTHGEIDIIAEKASYILFVEVKLRRIGSERPVLAVDQRKIKRIVETAGEFLIKNRQEKHITKLKPRFDVFEIYSEKGSIIKYFNNENVYD